MKLWEVFCLDIKGFLNKVCKEIKYEPARKGISEELEVHIQEIKEDYINNGISEIEAEEKAVKQMGIAEEIGKKLNKIHRPHLDWKLLLLIIILMGFSIFISFIKEPLGNDSYIGSSIIYMLLGLGLSIGIYFYDYKKLKKHSILVYLIATVILILPVLGVGYRMMGIPCIRIFGISFFPGTITVPLYIISFIGLIVDYRKDNAIKVKIQNEEFLFNKDFIKIIGLSILSIILMQSISTNVNTLILCFIYLVVTTIKILMDKEKRIKKLLVLYGSISIISILLIFAFSASPFRSSRILASFNPEIDPNGSGYIGMLQKEIMENAKLVGEADTEIISSDEYIISKESNYTFIYLLGKTGILVSGMLVLVIVLTSLKLLFNAKYIKEQYGKFLIIGLSSLYILQSMASVLMNINMGIQADVNIPFVSYGGVYFIVNILSMALIFSIYRRKDINIYEESQKSEGILKKLGILFIDIDKKMTKE